jgi:FkbM family methyltransferase
VHYLIPKAFRSLGHRFLAALPFDLSVSVAARLLEYQGFGAGAQVATSGELAVLDLLTGKKKPTLFDIGAHVGDYSAAFLGKFPEGRVFAFEPSARHFNLLTERLHGQRNARLLKAALGDAAGEATLYKDAEISGLASLTPRRLDHFGIAMSIEERVRVTTVDAARQQAKVDFIDLLKIDVEGHELDVLRGASTSLEERAIGLVQFEFGGCNLDTRTNLQDFFYFFAEHDYELSIVRRSGKLHALRRYSEMYEQYRTTNYVALPMRGGLL